MEAHLCRRLIIVAHRPSYAPTRPIYFSRNPCVSHVPDPVGHSDSGMWHLLKGLLISASNLKDPPSLIDDREIDLFPFARSFYYSNDEKLKEAETRADRAVELSEVNEVAAGNIRYARPPPRKRPRD